MAIEFAPHNTCKTKDICSKHGLCERVRELNLEISYINSGLATTDFTLGRILVKDGCKSPQALRKVVEGKKLLIHINKA